MKAIRGLGWDAVGQYLVPSLGKLADSAVDEIKKPQLTVPSEVREALPAVLRAQWRRDPRGP